jgi:hypothetical protein
MSSTFFGTVATVAVAATAPIRTVKILVFDLRGRIQFGLLLVLVEISAVSLKYVVAVKKKWCRVSTFGGCCRGRSVFVTVHCCKW